MSFSHDVSHAWDNGARSISAKNSYSAGAQLPSIDEVIPADSTEKEVVFALDISQLIAVVMLAEGDLKLETYNGAVLGDTIDLKAGLPYIWTEDSYDACLITEDITTLKVTEAESEDKRLQIEGLYDPTP